MHEQDRGRAWKLGAGFRGTHKITASASELIALSLGRDLMLPLVGTPFWHGIETFWNKVREELPTSVWEHYEKYRRFLAVLGLPTKSYEEHQGVLKTINRAILEHRVVEIEYQSIGKPVAQRRIEPLGVIYFQSSLYMLAVAQASGFAMKVGPCMNAPASLRSIPSQMLSLQSVAASVI